MEAAASAAERLVGAAASVGMRALAVVLSPPGPAATVSGGGSGGGGYSNGGYSGGGPSGYSGGSRFTAQPPRGPYTPDY